MHTHPDADSFVRAYLDHPADATTRLVFADWLEETGVPHNAAWAAYIRLRDDADHHPADSPTRRELLRQADSFAPNIRAKLTMSAKRFVGYPKSLLQLLPAANICARLANFAVPRTIIEIVPESAARENVLIPLAARDRTLLIAAADPHDFGIARRLGFILSRDIVSVGAAREDVVAAIDREYGISQTESEIALNAFVDEAIEFYAAGLPIGFETVPGVYEVHDGPEFLDDAIYAGNRRGADLVTFIPQGDIVRVYYRTPDGVTEAGRISRADWMHTVMPEILRRGNATGIEFTVEVVRHHDERAVRIWL